MFQVQIRAEVQGKIYKAALRYVDRQGQEHSKEVIDNAEEGDSRLRLELKAVLIGMERMIKPSEIIIETKCGYIKTGFDYMDTWKSQNWRKAGGKPVANQDLWEKLEEMSRTHKISVHVI